MRHGYRTVRHSRSGLQRGIQGALIAALLGAVAVAAAPVGGDDHLSAIAAMDSVHAAIGEIDRAERLSVQGPDAYRGAAQRAINDLVGSGDSRYKSEGDTPAGAEGALERLDGLADRSGSSPWAAPISAARVNVLAAVTQMEEALRSENLDDFQLHVSEALELLEMAVGRSTELGPLGGLSGALANTGLGVPMHARVTNGCTEPKSAPASGVVDGYLMYVAVPLTQASTTLPEALGTTVVSRENDILILHTAAQKLAGKLCAGAANEDSEPEHLATTGTVAVNPAVREPDLQHRSADPPGKGDPPKPPALYTEEQARAGKQIFDKQCVVCHGKNLQGASAPSVAGDDFLSAAHSNGWSVEDLRSIVAYNMPFNAPGTLSDKQAADVIAYLLAANCYPPGDTAFPQKETPTLGDIKLEQARKSQPNEDELGTCKVQ